MITVEATYENGVLRPSEPLELDEGEKVQLSVYPSSTSILRRPTSEEEDYIRRLESAKTLPELIAVFETAPQIVDDDFDIVKAINESRRLTGFRMPDPEPTEGTST